MCDNSRIWLSSPHMGGSEIEFIKEAFNLNMISPMGENVNGFEDDISKFLSNKDKLNVAALSSGTASLHLALKLLNVGLGDVVMVQSFTFCGTTNPVSYQGAEIVFIDSEFDTWNLCPIALRKALLDFKGKSVKAIIPVHLYGMPAKMDEIFSLSKEFNVPIIEDAAEALGSMYNGLFCGSFGLFSALSFNGNKIITTSGGGALVSVRKDLINEARFLATQARDKAIHYQHSQIGYNYRLSNVLAGIGRGQMKVLEERVFQRRAMNNEYRNFFRRIPGIKFQTEPSDKFYSNYWLTAILVDPHLTNGITKDDIRLTLESDNIETRPLWKPMHLQPIYNGCKFYGSGVCEQLFHTGICLPSGSNLSDCEKKRIFHSLKKLF
jgi:dTDP-4-amino-4,6-dideoxygalactose transaminase